MHYSNHNYPLNVSAEIDEFKNDIGLFLIGQQPPAIRTPSNDLRPKVSFPSASFCIDHTFPEEYMGGCKRRFN